MVKQSNRKDNISLFQSLRIAANTEEIASGIAGGVAIVVIIVGLIIYRNWRYEQELDSLLWKIDYKDIQIPDLPAVSSGQGKAPRVSLRAVRFHISNEREGESTAAIQIFLHSLSRVSIVREIISDSRVFIPLKKKQSLHPLLRTSQVSLSSNPETDFRYSAIYGTIGVYKGRIFAIKTVNKKSIDMTRSMKKELKWVSL